MANQDLAAILEQAASVALKQEPSMFAPRATVFLTELAKNLQDVDSNLAAEVFAVLINTPTMQLLPR